MKKYLLLASFAFTILSPIATAFAADMDEPLPPPPPPVTELRPASYDWTGAYVGAWGGLACIDGNLHDNTTATNYLNAGCGAKGGVLAGYNYQMDDMVFGVEADWGMTDKVVYNTDPTADFSFAMNNIATARGRFGYAFDDTLLFVTAGAAWATGDVDGIISATPDHIKGSHFGWTIGGGVEHAVTDTIRLKMDYLYTQLNTAHYSGACGTCDVDVDWGGEHEVRLGAIWSF
jgi:outer membrane immunogenic protein